MALYQWDEIIGKIKELKTELESVKKISRETHAELQTESKKTIENYQKTLDGLASTNKNLSNIEKEYNDQKKKTLQLQKQEEREAKKLQQSLDKEYQVKQKMIAQQKKQVQEYAKLEVEKKRLLELQQKEILSDKELIEKNTLLIRKRSEMVVMTKKQREEYKLLTSEIQRNDKVIKSNDKSIGRFQRNVGNYASAFKGFLGAAGVATGVYGVISVLKSGVKIIKDFEKANSSLKAVLGATKDEMKRLQSQAIDLGASSAFTSTEVTFLQTELARLGMTTQQVEAATGGVIAAAAAMGIGLSDAANLIGTTLNAFQLTADQSGKVADIFAEAVNKSALSANDLAVALPYVSASAKQANFSLEETVSMLGILTNNGIDASKAGTALRDIFIDLSTKGISFEDAMSRIANSTDKTKTAFEIFGKVSAGSAVILSENVKQTNDLTDALYKADGAAKRMAETMLDNLAGDIEQAGGAWESFVLSINSDSGVITTALRKVVQVFTDLITELTELNKYGKITSETARDGADQYIEKLKKELEGETARFKLMKIGNQLREKELFLNKLIEEKNPYNTWQGVKYARWKLTQQEKIDLLNREITLLNELSSDTNYLNGTKEVFTRTIKEETEEIDKNTTAWKKNIEEKKKVPTIDDIIFKPRPELNDESVFLGLPSEAGVNAEINRFMDVVTTKKSGFDKWLDQLLHGEGSILGRIFGGGENGEATAQALTETWQKFSEVYGAWIQQQIDKYDELISKQEDEIEKTHELLDAELDHINEAKKAGQAYDLSRKEALENQLKNEQKYLASTLAEQKKAKQKQKALAMTEATINMASAIMQIWASTTTKNYWVKLAQSIAFAALGAVQIGNIASARYATGTEYVDGKGHPDGVDTVPAKLTKGERVLTVKQNKLIPKGFKNEWIPMAVNHFLNGGVQVYDNPKVVKTLEGIENNTRQTKGYKPDGSLAWEIRGNNKIFYN
jgi:hypothetical protein